MRILALLAVAVDDPGSVEVVRRDLDADPIPRQDPDPEPPHLAGDVPEHLVAVIQLHPEHRVRERLDDLAFEFDLLFLGQGLDHPDVRRLRALRALAELVLDLRALREGTEAVPEIPEKWTNASFPPSSGVMNPKPFSSLNHFTTPLPIPTPPHK